MPRVGLRRRSVGESLPTSTSASCRVSIGSLAERFVVAAGLLPLVVGLGQQLAIDPGHIDARRSARSAANAAFTSGLTCPASQSVGTRLHAANDSARLARRSLRSAASPSSRHRPSVACSGLACSSRYRCQRSTSSRPQILADRATGTAAWPAAILRRRRRRGRGSRPTAVRDCSRNSACFSATNSSTSSCSLPSSSSNLLILGRLLGRRPISGRSLGSEQLAKTPYSE